MYRLYQLMEEEIAREIGDRRGEAFTSWNLGLFYEDSAPPGPPN